MDKETIKKILREGIIENSSKKEEKKNTSNDRDSNDKEYAYVQDKLTGGLLKASQVMKAAGLGDEDNATDRSLFSKKLRKFKDDEGGVYKFSAEELAAIIKVINNPISF